jgi:hypothetical protein
MANSATMEILNLYNKFQEARGMSPVNLNIEFSSFHFLMSDIFVGNHDNEFPYQMSTNASNDCHCQISFREGF